VVAVAANKRDEDYFFFLALVAVGSDTILRWLLNPPFGRAGR
jgi:hypothetical protein